MDIGDIAALIGAVGGVIGAGTGIWALIDSKQTRSEMRREKAPIIKITLGESDKWGQVTLTVRSRSNVGYELESIQAVWPLDARIADPNDAPKEIIKTDNGARRVMNWRKAIRPTLKVKAEGNASQLGVMGSGDEHHVSFLVAARSKLLWRLLRTPAAILVRSLARSETSSHKVSFRLRISLIDENSKKIVRTKTATVTYPANPTKPQNTDPK
ncbi:hypothetical protein [Pelagibacterium lentulum]|uniref:Uncharacterized protein n=1 Tax=Pelagibacterium lentulum TaxID=2029865 RepID=A0A916RRT2_9HYPH|nr:hypothetical protein [Pelagibacterium lentulum]GGA64666.1 hypothetical protein GCM10011499_38920 [Pelagibacterium lentulum]